MASSTLSAAHIRRREKLGRWLGVLVGVGILGFFAYLIGWVVVDAVQTFKMNLIVDPRGVKEDFLLLWAIVATVVAFCRGR